MDSLDRISMFVQVADTRSFTETRRQLGFSSSALEKSIARMEEHLGVRLFHPARAASRSPPKALGFWSVAGAFSARSKRPKPECFMPPAAHAAA